MSGVVLITNEQQLSGAAELRSMTDIGRILLKKTAINQFDGQTRCGMK